MKDFAQEVDAIFTALLAARSPADRVRMACAMFDDAKALATAGIRAEEPDISAAELRVRLFERLYWDDFEEDTRRRVADGLR